MQPAFDQTSIRLTLMKAVQNGRFTVDALDHPSAWVPPQPQGAPHVL